MSQGLIFDVQRFSVHDGPGVRTTVFFKGCPLGCLWCHNPQSRGASPEIRSEPRLCVACGACLDFCPNGLSILPAEEAGGNGGRGATPSGCTLCGNCVEGCPTEARVMVGRWVAAVDLAEEVARDRVFFEESGGGVTFSGGEPLAQPRFLVDLLQACRAAGLHTVVDTSGYGARRWLKRVAGQTSLFLFDVKVLDEARHRRFTGVSNREILENLRALDALGSSIWLRVPVIPGFNDDEANLAGIRDLAASLGSVERVCLLPFHRHGLHRRAGTGDGDGAAGALEDLEAPTRDRLEDLAGPFRAAGLPISIGG